MTKNTPILAISFDDGQLSAVVLNGGSPRSIHGAMAVDPLSDDAALTAQELRERLAPLGRLPRQVIVLLPLNRVLQTTIALPQMPADVVDGYLQLQAEKEFLLPPTDMAFGASRAACGGAERVTMMAMPLTLFNNLRRALRLLGWKRPLVTSLPVAMAAEQDGVAGVLLVGPRWIDLVVSCDRQLVLVRRMAGVLPGAARPMPDLAAVAGELRLSLGQLAPEIRRRLERLTIVGPPEPATTLHAELTTAGLRGMTFDLGQIGREATLLAHAAERGAMAARSQSVPITLAPIAAPASRHAWMRWTRRQLVGSAAIALLLIGALTGFVLHQQRQLTRLEATWQAMEPRAKAVREILDDVQAREAWMSDQPLTLDVMRVVTLAFPERGSVWTTRVEIRDRERVSITGKALNREAWLAMLEQLRQSSGVRDLRVSQAREASDGRSPMTFALTFTWRTPSPLVASAREVTP